MRAVRTLLTVLAIGVGCLCSLATTNPNRDITDVVDLGSFQFEQGVTVGVSARVLFNPAAESMQSPCALSYDIGVLNESVSSGVMHFWILDAPLEGAIDPDLEPALSAVVRGRLQGEDGRARAQLTMPCPTSGTAVHLALTVEGDARGTAGSLLEAVLTGSADNPDGAAIEIEVLP